MQKNQKADVRGVGRWALHLNGGAERDRTDDLLSAIQALSQLSYSPICSFCGEVMRTFRGRLSPERVILHGCFRQSTHGGSVRIPRGWRNRDCRNSVAGSLRFEVLTGDPPLTFIARKFAAFLFFMAIVAPLSAEITIPGAVKKVESSKVCMINERFMNVDQIPIVVNGKTYYGCCEMCKTALAENASKRVAKDPVSGIEVDKAVAVIGAQADGKILYFESVESMKKYNASVLKGGKKKLKK